MKQLCSAADQLCGTVDAKFLGVKGKVVILGRSPFEIGIEIIVVGPLLILFGNKLCRVLCFNAVLLHGALHPAFLIRVNVDIEAIGIVTQNIVAAAADYDARPLLCHLLDNIGLEQKELVVDGQIIGRELGVLGISAHH